MIIDCSKSCYDHSINGKETIHLIIHFGACLGALVPPCVADNIGRQNSLGLSATLCAISWSILAFAKDNTVSSIFRKFIFISFDFFFFFFK